MSTPIIFTIAPHLPFNVMEEAPPPPPIFNLPPPPRPPDLPCPLEDQQQARPLHHQSSTLPVVKDLFQESCDINYVIDSRLYLGENLFTLLIVLVCSCILVGIVMTIGLLIYRRRSFFRRAMYKRDEMKNTETTNSQLEMSDRHVYANPSYAGHFEIGGMPFYLPSPPPPTTSNNDASAVAKMSEEESSSPPPPPSLRPIIPGGNRNGGVDLLGNASDCSTMPWYDNSSLRPQLLPSSRRLPASSQKTVSPAADNEVGGCMGPIYEDIDRMCSYRGYPPDSYYNLSGGSSPRNKSSNSEGSFDVKPSTPRSSSTTTGPRSSNAASSAAGNNSIYYYSDTLRKGRVGSDSGISVDTPPPRLQSSIRGQNNPRACLVQTEAVLTERKRLRRLHDTKV